MVLRIEGGLERGGASREGRGPSSEAEPHARGWVPRAAGTRPRGRQALERGGCLVLRRQPLE
jgi:hypothetical protein